MQSRIASIEAGSRRSPDVGKRYPTAGLAAEKRSEIVLAVTALDRAGDALADGRQKAGRVVVALGGLGDEVGVLAGQREREARRGERALDHRAAPDAGVGRAGPAAGGGPQGRARADAGRPGEGEGLGRAR